MNKKLLLLALQMFCLQATAQVEKWHKIHLDDSTTIEFPGTPEKKLAAGRQVTFFQDDNAIYSVIIDPGAYDGNPIDSELAKFYKGTLKGMLNAFGGGTIIEDSAFRVDGFPGRQVLMDTPNKSHIPRLKAVQILLANGTFYTTNFWTNTAQNPAVDSARKHFFASFQTNRRKTAAVEPETQSRVYKLGGLMGTLFAYGLVIYGLVVVVRRWLKPKSV